MNETRATTPAVVSSALLRVRQALATHDTRHSSRWRQRPIVEHVAHAAHAAAHLDAYAQLASIGDLRGRMRGVIG